jgi:hypothetical protein
MLPKRFFHLILLYFLPAPVFTGRFGDRTTFATARSNDAGSLSVPISRAIWRILLERSASVKVVFLAGMGGNPTLLRLMGHEKDPMASLAAYFSRWRDTFDPDGAGNWELRQELKAAE